MEATSFDLFVKSITSTQIFQEALREAVSQAIKNQETISDPDPVFYSRLDVARILKISLPTVDRYTNLGLLEANRVGNRILYKKEVVLNSLDSLQSRKHKRQRS
jgi:hypothetical protein